MMRNKFKRKLFIDFETRSEEDVTDVGAHRYNMDASTEIILVSWAYDDEDVTVSTELPESVQRDIESRDVMKIAHNAEFELCVCKYILKLDIVFSDWFDTAFAASYFGYPRALAFLSNVLGTTRKASGVEMHTFSICVSKSKPPAENEIFALPQPAVYNEAKDHPEEWAQFEMYSKYDTIVLREVFEKLPPLPQIEIFTMHITFEMNFNGCPFDVSFAKEIHKKSQEYSYKAGIEAKHKYDINNLRSPQQVQAALRLNGIHIDSLNKKTREETSHEILDLRDQASGAAFSKIPTAFKRMCPDNRLRGEFVGNGAHTGRWSSRGTQLQNWARILSKVSTDLSLVRDYDHLRQHMRLCLGYLPGYDFNVADLSQIEARIVAWLANCQWRIKAFANEEDIYARSAEKMFNKEHVTKDDPERFLGKTYELALGYGAGADKVASSNYDLLKKVGHAKIKKDVQTWRTVNREIVNLWYSMQDAWVYAMQNGSKRLQCGQTAIVFQYDGKTMRITLPSGRALYYRSAHIIQSDYGRPEIYYLDYSRGGGHSVRTKIWGGTLLENITQAIARDVMVVVMKRVKDRAPQAMICGTVHDEAWYLKKREQAWRPDQKDVDVLSVMLSAMSEPISWAKGLITKGEGETSDRYRKK